MRVAIFNTPFDPLAELAAFEQANIACGALASFVGRCRATAAAGAVRAHRLQHYEGFTQREIEDFARTLVGRLRLDDVLVVHRVGEILPNDPIVLVATASAHRAEALEATQALIDFLKTDAPLWKQEITTAGAAWIEPTAQDYERRMHSKS